MENEFSYIPHTIEDRKKMLDFLGISTTEDLFSDIPPEVRMKKPLQLIPSLSELELERHMRHLAQTNMDVNQLTSFLGGGSYEHYQPSVIDAIISRSEFYTSYTPYQPEISQGMLQAIFEYQTMVAELTGMDLANASMYDGPTAMAEAGIVCCSQTKRNKLIVASTVHPEYRSVLDTYASGQSIQVVTIGQKNGVLDISALRLECDDTVAGVLLQYPNYLGYIEEIEEIVTLAHQVGALLVMAAYPIALGLLKSPGELGADIVVAEGQSLGNSMSYGGPYLGIMAAKKELMRRLPGRIVGQTTDHEGKRGFVLTLQAREQHIRREKASSNICSNQALNALAATVYMSYMGKQGIHEVAMQNYHKAHYLFQKLKNIKGIEVPFQSPFFNEFVIQLHQPVEKIQRHLLEKGILFGIHVTQDYPDLENCVLITVTEMRTREEMDHLCDELKEVLT